MKRLLIALVISCGALLGIADAEDPDHQLGPGTQLKPRTASPYALATTGSAVTVKSDGANWLIKSKSA